MYVRSLSLTDFRNIKGLSLDFSPGFNIIMGDNAQGKTNTMEAICLALCAKSHRESVNANFVRFEAEKCQILADVVCDDYTTAESRVEVLSGRRSHFVDSQRIKSAQSLMRLFSCVFFSPEDLRLVKDSPQLRRSFMDESISVLFPSYAGIMNSYKKTLKQRGMLLKNFKSSDGALLDVYDANLVDLGSEIMKYRIKFLRDLSLVAAKYYASLSSEHEKISLSYVSNVISTALSADEIKQSYEKALKESRAVDLAIFSTSIGVHHDDVNFFINGADAKRFASQGQQRSIAVSLKMAVCDLIMEKKSQMPVVLLDDVMSELDESRRSALVRMLMGKQVFITCTGVDFDTGENTFFFKAANGVINRINFNFTERGNEIWQQTTTMPAE